MFLSIVIPCYNGEKYILDCLKSIADQSFKDFECIIVDDGSTDNSFTICEKFKNGDKRFKVLHKENGGVGTAWNLGMEAATGEYIQFIDADDYLIPDALLMIRNKINDSYPDILFFNYIEKRAQYQKVCDLDLLECIKNKDYFDYIPHMPYKFKTYEGVLYRYGGFFSSVWRMWIKRSIIKNNGVLFSSEYRRQEDMAFVRSLVKHANTIEYSDIYPYVYRIHNASTMHTVRINNEPSADKPIIDQWRTLVDDYSNSCKRYKHLSNSLFDHARMAYKYNALNSIINCAGKTDICNGLDLLFKDSVFKKWFSWEYVFSQYSGRERMVLLFYKLHAYKLIERIHRIKEGLYD